MKKNMYNTIKSALDLLGHYDNDYAQGEGNIRDACKELQSLLQQKKEIEVSDNLHPHSRKLLKVCFEELGLKMLKNQNKYGWSNEWLTSDWEDECREEMMKHVDKGDPRDVAIYALFMIYRGWSTAHVRSQLSAKDKEKAAWVDYLIQSFELIEAGTNAKGVAEEVLRRFREWNNSLTSPNTITESKIK